MIQNRYVFVGGGVIVNDDKKFFFNIEFDLRISCDRFIIARYFQFNK